MRRVNQAPSHPVRDRRNLDTRPLSIPFPPTVSLSSAFPRGSAKPSAPSRPLPSGVTKEPQLTLLPQPDVDARGFPRKDPTCALSGVRMDACFDSLQMFPRLSPASATLRRGCLPTLAADVFPTANPSRAFPSAVDARAFARRYARNALPGLAKIARANAKAIAHVPTPDAPAYAVEGALATLFPSPRGIISQRPSLHPRPAHRHSRLFHFVIPDSSLPPRESIPRRAGAARSSRSDRRVALPGEECGTRVTPRPLNNQTHA